MVHCSRREPVSYCAGWYGDETAADAQRRQDLDVPGRGSARVLQGDRVCGDRVGVPLVGPGQCHLQLGLDDFEVADGLGRSLSGSTSSLVTVTVHDCAPP